MTWGMLADLIADATGFYGLDAHGRVWAMDFAGHERWSASVALPANRGNSLAVTPDGFVLAWSQQDHAAWVLAGETGEIRGTFGGVEPAGATVHHLDLLGIRTLTACADGTFVAIFEERLVRFGRDGVGVELWPGVRAKPGPLYLACPQRPDKDAQTWDVALRRRSLGAGELLGYDWRGFKLDALRSQPLAIAWNVHAALQACPDGDLLVRTRDGLARFDARGERRFARELPVDEIVDIRRPCCDRAGAAHVVGRHRNPRGEAYVVVLRVSRDGATVDEPVRDTRLGGALALTDFEQVAIAPDGTVAVAGNNGRFQVLPAPW